MAGMSFIGSYSGIDKSTIDQLMEAEKMPLLKLSNAKVTITEKQNAWKDINTRLNSLFEKLKTLQSNSTFTSKTSTSSNDKNVSMTAGNNATAGSYKVRIESLATSATVVGTKILKDKQDNNTKLGISGEFTINVDLTDKEIEDKFLKDNNKVDVTIDEALRKDIDKYIEDYKRPYTVAVGTDNSLNDITANINKLSKDTGVTAVIIDGRLSLAHKETGELKQIVLKDVPGKGNLISGENNNLDPKITSLGLEGGAKKEAGADAIFSINDIPLTSASNNVKGALEGVTINLTKAHDPLNNGDYDTVTIAGDNTVLTKAVQEFVDQYNSTMTFIEDKMKAGDPKLAGSKGTLAGDSSLMRLHSSLRNLVTSPTTNSNTDIKDMSQLGVTTIDKFGQLKFDASKLAKELSKDADGVKNFFNSTVGGKEVGFTTRLKDYVDSFITSDKGVIKVKTESFDKTLKDLTAQIDNFSARMEKKEAYYIKKFTALDVAIMKSEDQMSWLQGQVDSMNGIKR